jgi:alpha-mannosidase
MTYAVQPHVLSADLQDECNRLFAETRHWIDRFAAEIDFARGLTKALPAESGGWPALIDRAEQHVAGIIALGDAKQIRTAIEASERQLAAIGTVAKTFTIHCAGHAHIDMNWMWGWHETVATTVDTFETVLKLMDEFPEFTYTQSQASVYEIVREYAPELLERIKKRISEGRWEVAASHWVEGDKNLASGESLCRHLLYTRRYLQELLGLKPEDVTIDWSPDTFGHAHTIPSIDARGGVKHYYCCRTGDPNRPPVFWWKGPDGSKILVSREILWYNGEPRPASTRKLLEFHDKTGLREWMQVYGVGDHGGGPTRRDLRCIVDMNQWPIFPNVRFSTVKEFYAKLEKAPNLPTLDQELNYEFSGCYTSQSSIKKSNRLGENLMSEADAAALLAFTATGRPYPAEQLRKAWRDVLFSHFHDILPGSGVRATREYNAAMTQNVQARAGQVRTQSLRALAKAIDTGVGGKFISIGASLQPENESVALGAGAGRAIGDLSVSGEVTDGPRAAVIFNPSAWARTEMARVTVWDMDTGPNPRPMNERRFLARAADGSEVIAQAINSTSYWGHNFVDLAFPATVGANGWTTYQVAEAPGKPKPRFAMTYEAGFALEDTAIGAPFQRVSATRAGEGGGSVNNAAAAIVLENDQVRVRFDQASGGIVSYVVKATGQELAVPGETMAQLEYVVERTAGMTAWVIGDTIERRELKADRVDITQSGPHVATVRAKGHVGESTFTIEYELQAGSNAVSVSIDANWLERGSNEKGIPRLQIRFPFALTKAKARYEIPYGSITREEIAGREVPALRWASLTGTLAGKTVSCAVLNDCKYGHAVDGSTLRVNLVRSSFDPDPLPEVGQQQARFAIVPFSGDASVADLMRVAGAFNQPLLSVVSDHHAGALPNNAEALRCSADNVVVTQLKRSEDGDALIVRLLETAGTPTVAEINLTRALLGAVESVKECDVLERDLGDGGAKAQGNGFTVKMGAHAITTVKVALKR